MASRIDLGSAEYALIVDEGPLVASLAKAEAAAKNAAAQTAAAVRQQNQAYAAFGQQVPQEVQKVIAAQQAVAASAKATATATAAAYREQLAAAKQASAGQIQAAQQARQAQQQSAGGSRLAGVGSGIVAGATAAGLNLGVQAVVGAGKQAIEDAADAERAIFSLNATFGEGSKAAGEWADRLADATGSSDEAIKRALVSTRLYTQELGLTDDQAKALVERATDLAAVYGGDLTTALNALEGTLRGNTRAGAAYGITLKGLDDEELKRLQALGPLATAQELFSRAMDQSNDKAGKAVELMETNVGGTLKFKRSIDELSESLGASLLPDLAEMAKGLAGIADGVSALNNVQLPDWMRDAMHGRPGGGPSAFEAAFGRKPGQAGKDTLIGPGGSWLDIGGKPAEPAAKEAGAAIAKTAKETADAVKQEADRAAEAASAAAKKMLTDSQTAWDGIDKAHKEVLDNSKKAAEEQFNTQKQAIEDTRDKDVEASQERLQATIRDLDARKQAADDYFANEIENVENARDRDIAAVEARRDAALAGIEAEQQAVATRRTQEDRDIEDRREGERRSIAASTAMTEAAVNGEIEGITRVKDEALKAIDERIAAEDRRHTEAIANLDREEARQLGIIDDALEAMDKQAEQERRAETDEQNRHNLSVAKQDVKSAKTPQEKATARNEVTRAEIAIEKEARNRARADAREVLRDRADAIKKEFDLKKKAETDKSKLTKDGLEDDKKAATTSADDQIKEYQRWLKGYKESQSQATTALQDRYKDEDRQREDNRKLEDKAFEDRKTAAKRSADDEITEIKRVAQGRIDGLRDQQTASDRYYATQKQKAQDEATHEQTKIKETAEFHIRALRTETDATIAYLDRMGKEWESWSTRVKTALKNALGDLKGYLSGAVKVEWTVSGGGTGGRYQPGTDAGTVPSGLGESTGQSPYADPTRGTVGRGELLRGTATGQRPSGRAYGGAVFAGQDYLVGERRPEIFRPSQNGEIVPNQDLLNDRWRQQAKRSQPAGQAAQPVSVSITNNVDGRGVQNVDQLADLVVARSTHAVIGLLDKSERMHAQAVSSDQGRAL